MAWNWDRDYKSEPYTAEAAPKLDAGMDDFLASARKLTDQFLEQSRQQAAKILNDANMQAGQIVEEARQKAEELMRGAESHAEEITQHAQQEADALVEEAKAEAERLKKPGTIDQEYAVQCVSDCFEEIRRRQEESLDMLNAQWQKFLIGLMPVEDELPAAPPAPAAEPEAPAAPAPGAEDELPYDLEEKVSALSREMDELFWNRKN